MKDPKDRAEVLKARYLEERARARLRRERRKEHEANLAKKKAKNESQGA